MLSKQDIYIAVAGKGVERGLKAEDAGDYIILHYPEGTDARQDNLHKQSIRSLVKRIASDWIIHIQSLDDQAGMSVEVRPKPGTDKAEPEVPTEKEVVDSQGSSDEKLERLVSGLRELVDSIS